MNKKAVLRETLIWFFVRLVVILFLIGIVATLVNGAIKKRLDSEDLRFYPIVERVLYSCFAYVDERPYPGIIDVSKYTQETISNCMASGTEAIAARFFLSYQDKRKVVYYKEDMYNDLVVLKFSNLYASKSRRYFVLVKEQDSFIPASFEVEVLWRK